MCNSIRIYNLQDNGYLCGEIDDSDWVNCRSKMDDASSNNLQFILKLYNFLNVFMLQKTAK